MIHQRIHRTIAAALFAALGVGTHAQQALFVDDFSGVSGQRPDGWQVSRGVPETGPYFLTVNGELSTGNGDDLSVAGGYTYATVARPEARQWEDYSINVDFRCRQYNGRIVVVGRFQDINNHYAAYLDVSRTLDGRQRKVGIEVVEGGSRRLLGPELVDGVGGVVIPQIEGMKAANEARNLTLTFFKDRISLALDGKTIISGLKDQTFTRGTAGVGQRYNEIVFDNFKVVPVDEKTGLPQVAPAPAPAPALGPVEPGVAQAAPTFYWVAVAEGQKEEEARARKVAVNNKGYQNVIVNEEGGQWRVLVGAFFSQREAESNMEALRVDGLQPVRIITTRVDVAAPAEEAIYEYRVVSRTFTDQARAQVLKDSLTQDGFTPNQILSEGNGYAVAVGPFNTVANAQSAMARLEGAGYLNMAVTRRPLVALARDIADLSSTDIERIVQAQIRRTGDSNRTEMEGLIRSIFDTLMKEQNKRTEGEIQTIRERLAGIEDQKALLAQLSQDVTAEKKRKDEIARLVDAISDAIDQKNWNQAEDALKKLQTADPGNPQIDIKQNVIRLGKLNIPDVADIYKSLTSLNEQVRTINLRSVDDVKRAMDHAEEVWKESRTQKDLVVQAYIEYQSIAMTAKDMLARADTPDSLKDALKKAQEASDARIATLRPEFNDLMQKRQDIENRVAEIPRQQRYIWYAIGAVGGVMALFIVFLFLAIRSQQKKHKEILKLVSDIPMRPVLPVGEEKRQLAGAGGPMQLAAAAAGAGTVAMSAPEAELEIDEVAPPFQENESQDQVVVTAGSDRQTAGAADSYYEDPTLIETPEDQSKDVLGFDITEPVGDVPVFGQEEPPAPIQPESAPAGVSPDVISFDELTSSPDEKTPDDSLSGFLSDESLTPAGSATDATISMDAETQETPRGRESAMAGFDLNLDDLTPLSAPSGAPEAETVSKPVVSKAETAPSAADDVLDLSDILGTEIPEVSSQTIPAAIEPLEEDTVETPAAGPAGTVVLDESLDGQNAGERPNGWTGDYPYATLSIETEAPPQGRTRYLKFEKTSGAGSAHFSRTFPDVGGVIEVEFDLCCKDKNRYLLGFYIEKDADFRQSIHTIIHRTDPQSSSALRLQGESSSYQFGQWARVRYEIDLNEGFVNGFVNGKKVADKVALTSCPDSLNTLSIRDNLATTGVLLIGGLKIKKIA